jgi:hypothetical protein
MGRYPSAIFMHDLPAHRGEEVDPEVLDGDRSVAFQEAAHKLYGRWRCWSGAWDDDVGCAPRQGDQAIFGTPGFVGHMKDCE